MIIGYLDPWGNPKALDSKSLNPEVWVWIRPMFGSCSTPHRLSH